MVMTGALSVTPVRPSISAYVHFGLSVRTSHQRRLLSKSNSFDQNFMKLGHIVKYHYVFVKFDNVLYRTMPSGVTPFCF